MTSETTLDLSLRFDMTVTDVPQAGLGASAGFLVDDKIVEVQGKSVKNAGDIRQILDKLSTTDSVTFGISRAKQRLTLGPVPISSSLNGTAYKAEPQRTYSSLGLRHGDSAIPLTTGPSIPGRVVSKVLGLVFGAGNAAWTIEGTSGKAGTALDKASQALVSEARSIGADAVVSITFSMDGSGNSVNRSQTITLLGTAVRLESLPDAQEQDGRHSSGN